MIKWLKGFYNGIVLTALLGSAFIITILTTAIDAALKPKERTMYSSYSDKRRRYEKCQSE